MKITAAIKIISSALLLCAFAIQAQESNLGLVPVAKIERMPVAAPKLSTIGTSMDSERASTGALSLESVSADVELKVDTGNVDIKSSNTNSGS